MTTVVRTHQILVHAPLHSTFDYVSDLTRHPEWSSGRLTIQASSSGPVAVGKEYISHGEVAVQKDRFNTVRITAYEPPHRFGFTAHDPNFGDVSHVFTFTEQGGDVLITRRMTLSLHPLVAIFFRFLIYPLIGHPSMEKSLGMLKIQLEGR